MLLFTWWLFAATWMEPRFDLIACPWVKDIRVATIKTTGTVRWVARGNQKALHHDAITHLSLSLLLLAIVLFITTTRTHTHMSLWADTGASKEFFALQFEVQSNLLKALCSSPWGGRGGDGEWRGIREVWQSEGAGCAVWVCTCKQWSLCIFQSLLGRHNMSSMRCLNSVSSMEVPLHTCMCMCTYVCVCHAWTHRDNTYDLPKR